MGHVQPPLKEAGVERRSDKMEKCVACIGCKRNLCCSDRFFWMGPRPGEMPSVPNVGGTLAFP